MTHFAAYVMFTYLRFTQAWAKPLLCPERGRKGIYFYFFAGIFIGHLRALWKEVLTVLSQQVPVLGEGVIH